MLFSAVSRPVVCLLFSRFFWAPINLNEVTTGRHVGTWLHDLQDLIWLLLYFGFLNCHEIKRK